MAIHFGISLLFSTWFICIGRKFLGFVFFIVYVGGILILIRYCVILLPMNKFLPLVVFSPFLTGLVVQLFIPQTRGLALGLYYSGNVIFLIALLLILVILSVIEIVDYSRGAMKI